MTSSQAPADLATRRAGKLTDTVYASLRDDIYAFRLLPGDRFAENDVAERLQVSRTPVREALMRLQSEGLVRGHFRNGWEVVPIDLARFASHTYCGLEMAIMQIRPINSWNQRLRSKPCALAGAVWVRVVMRFSCTESQSGTASLAGSGRMPLD